MVKKVSLISSIEQGLMGILSTAFPVFLINWMGSTFALAWIPGLSQALLTFCMVAINTLIFQFLYVKRMKISAIAIPTLLTTSLSYTLHSSINSPEVYLSVLFVFGSAIFYFTILSIAANKHMTISVSNLYNIYYKRKNK